MADLAKTWVGLEIAILRGALTHLIVGPEGLETQQVPSEICEQAVLGGPEIAESGPVQNFFWASACGEASSLKRPSTVFEN